MILVGDPDFELHVGDVRDCLRKLPDESVHMVVTSPPYWGLRDYNVPGQLGLEPTPEQYVENMVVVFREVRRVLRRDGTCWLNMGDSYAASVTSDRHFAQPANGLKGTPATKHPPQFGGQRTAVSGLKPKDLVGMPWKLAFALQSSGWYLRSDIVWSKPNPMPESVTDRPTKAHEYVFLLTRSPRYFFDADAVREQDSGRPSGNGFVRPHRLSYGDRGREERWTPGTGRNLRSVWEIAAEPFPEAHFATFPQALVERCVKAGSREGGVVLDPFLGSGTTALVCRRLGRKCIGIELSAKYGAMAAKRLSQLSLLAI